MYHGVHELAGLLVYKDYPELRWKPKPGEVRSVWEPLDQVCTHGVDLQVSCFECDYERDNSLRFPRKEEPWWRRLLSR